MTSSSRRLRVRLFTTTGLVAAALLAGSGVASAASTTVSTARTTPLTLNGGDDATVTSTGTISGGTVTRGIINSGAVANFITNNGTIAAHYGATQDTGIFFLNGGLTGALTNTGLIQAQTNGNSFAVGVNVSNSSIAGAFANSGTIRANVTDSNSSNIFATGLLLQNHGTLASLNNTGVISGTGLLDGGEGAHAHGYGIEMALSNITGLLSNSGTISGSATSHNGTSAGGTATGIGVYLLNNSTINALTNTSNGVISAIAEATSTLGAQAAGYGVYLNQGTITGALTNAGTISGGATSQGNNTNGTLAIGAGVYLANGSTIASLTNTGTIAAQGANTVALDHGRAEAYAVFVSDSTITGALTNSSVITGTANATGTNGEAYASAVGINTAGGATVGSVTNTGTITATSTAQSANNEASATASGIYLNQTTVNGAVSNQGTITAVAHATALSNNGSAYAYGISLAGTTAGALSNSGTISASASAQSFATNAYASAEGIEMHNSSVVASLSNTGTITVNSITDVIDGTGDASATATGIYVGDGSTITGALTNSGTIMSTGTATASEEGVGYATEYGLRFTGASTTGSVTNQAGGVISASANGVGESNNGEANAYGININQATITNALTNNGTITATAHAEATDNNATANAYGIYLTGTDALGSLTNTGKITAIATATATNSGGFAGGIARGVFIDGGTITGALTNTGTIAANATTDGDTNGAQAYGIEVSGAANLAGGIVNSGLITATNTPDGGEGSSFGILVNNASVSGGITNNDGGTITSSSGTAILLGNLTAATPLTINGGRIIGDVFNTNPASGYSPTQIAGDFTTEGNFNVSRLNVSNNKTLIISPGDTVTLNTMTASNGGTFAFGVNSATDHGNLVVTNSAINLAGATVREDGIASGIVEGDVFRVATGNAAIIGGPGATPTVIDDTSYLWNFEDVNGLGAPGVVGGSANDLYFIATQAMSLAAAADNSNNRNASNVLQRDLADSTDPRIVQIQSNLNNAPDRQSYNETLESTQPTTDNGSPMAAANFTGQVFDVADSQLAMVNTGDPTGVAAGDMAKGLHPWAQAFGQHADQDDRSGVDGYRANTVGGAFGVDTRNFNDDTVVGLSLAYGYTHVNSENANSTDTNVNTYQATLYGNHAFGDTDYFVAGMGAVGYDRNHETRHDVGGIDGLDASAGYDSWQGAGRVEGGRNFRMAGPLTGLTLTPILTADYIHYSAESYDEKGAGGANLQVGHQNEDMLQFGIGGRAQYLIKADNGLSFKPDVHASYQYDVLNNDKVDDNSSFQAGGGTFSTRGLNPSNSTFDVGAGLKVYNAGPWDFTTTADYTAKADYNAYSGMIRAGYKF